MAIAIDMGSIVEAKCGTKKVLRFHKSERMMHWAIAVPFLICFATALILIFYYNPNPLRPYRNLFSIIHRLSGVSFIVMPLFAALKSKGNVKVHFYNIKQAWLWTFEDIKWLMLMGIAAVSSKVTLPKQGKFNAAEKINFMNLMATYPLYIITGLTVWLTSNAFSAWIVHFLMAAMVTPLILGHLYMAIINPASRKGLSGMFSGEVDSDWAKHHYGKWHAEHFGDV